MEELTGPNLVWPKAYPNTSALEVFTFSWVFCDSSVLSYYVLECTFQASFTYKASVPPWSLKVVQMLNDRNGKDWKKKWWENWERLEKEMLALQEFSLGTFGSIALDQWALTDFSGRWQWSSFSIIIGIGHRWSSWSSIMVIMVIHHGHHGHHGQSLLAVVIIISLSRAIMDGPF